MPASSARKASRAGKGAAARPKPPPRAGRSLTGGVRALWRSFSGVGLVLGAAFFAASLTPSLIPRGFALQGVLAGVCFAVGYGLGILMQLFWAYLQLPIPSERIRRGATWAAAAVAGLVVIVFVWQAAEWQDSIRLLMGMEPVETAHPLEVALIAAVVFAVLILLSRLFRTVFRQARSRAARYVPERISQVIGIAVAVLLFVLIANGVLFRTFIEMSDRSFAALDALIEPEYAAPAEPSRTGSAASLVDWGDMGRAGREFVATGPTREDLSGYFGTEAAQPLRIYVGLGSADDPEARAELALAEMIRVGAFERSVLVVAVPTGTGWMDPAATDTLEYLHRGDTAIVAVQYSYLTSPLSLLVEPGFSQQSGRALFRLVYAQWAALPEASRPRLYLYGLSLGAYGSEQSFRLHEVLADPFDGALWTGPPFATPEWRSRDGRAQSGLAGMAADLRRQLAGPIHHPGERARHPGGALGADADRLPAIRERSDHLLQPECALPRARLDGPAARAGRVARAALVPGRDLPAARPRHGGRAHGADRPRPLLRAGALRQRLDRGDGAGGLDARGDRAAEGQLRRMTVRECAGRDGS